MASEKIQSVFDTNEQEFQLTQKKETEYISLKIQIGKDVLYIEEVKNQLMGDLNKHIRKFQILKAYVWLQQWISLKRNISFHQKQTTELSKHVELIELELQRLALQKKLLLTRIEKVGLRIK